MIDVIFLFRHRCGSDLASTAALPAPFWKTPVLELFGPPMKKSRGELCHPQPRRGGQLGVEAGDPQLRTSQMSAQDKTSSESTVESKMQGLHSGINRNTGLCVCVCVRSFLQHARLPGLPEAPLPYQYQPHSDLEALKTHRNSAKRLQAP